MAWDRLSVSKFGGGLGVKSLGIFNKAMLAKQGWRILNEENPLVSKILKAKYFPKSDFLNAKLGANPNYMWKSIMSAQDAIRSGCRRRIGDGLSTKVWEVPWLPSVENVYVTTTAAPELKDIEVYNLYDVNTNGWDYDILTDVFNSRDCELIKQILIPLRWKEDSWFWLLDDRGMFTFKSMYRQLQREYDMSLQFLEKVMVAKNPREGCKSLMACVQGMFTNTCCIGIPTC